jgi:hypothetical protein
MHTSSSSSSERLRRRTGTTTGTTPRGLRHVRVAGIALALHLGARRLAIAVIHLRTATLSTGTRDASYGSGSGSSSSGGAPRRCVERGERSRGAVVHQVVAQHAREERGRGRHPRHSRGVSRCRFLCARAP